MGTNSRQIGDEDFQPTASEPIPDRVAIAVADRRANDDDALAPGRQINLVSERLSRNMIRAFLVGSVGVSSFLRTRPTPNLDGLTRRQ